MANDAFAINFSPPRSGATSLLAPAGFTALLLLVFVTLSPFVPPPAITVFGLPGTPSANGDALRQVCYLGVFAVILFAALRARGVAVTGVVPLTVTLLLLWCLTSALWAAEPGVTFRRAGLASIIVLSVLLSVETLGTERAFRIWRIVLALILAVNWISIPLVHTAVHLPGELDPGLVGDWRGLYNQKNTAGAVSAMTVLLFLFSKNGARNWIGILVSLAAIGFLIMTRSKSSLGFLPIALIAGWLYHIGWRRGIDRTILITAGTLLAFGIAAFVILNTDWISHILEDPTEFTGRTAIWHADLAFVRDHLLLGAGFGTVADTGGLPLLHNYVSETWIETIGASHNGYMELFVTIGAIGFVFAMAAVIVEPMLRFWPLQNGANAFKVLLFALFTFVVLHNLMESDFLESDSGAWFALLMVIAGLREGDKSLTPPR